MRRGQLRDRGLRGALVRVVRLRRMGKIHGFYPWENRWEKGMGNLWQTLRVFDGFCINETMAFTITETVIEGLQLVTYIAMMALSH